MSEPTLYREHFTDENEVEIGKEGWIYAGTDDEFGVLDRWMVPVKSKTRWRLCVEMYHATIRYRMRDEARARERLAEYLAEGRYEHVWIESMMETAWETDQYDARSTGDGRVRRRRRTDRVPPDLERDAMDRRPDPLMGLPTIAWAVVAVVYLALVAYVFTPRR